MIDYKKAEQAKELLEESGVPFILVYGKANKHFTSRVCGEYQTLKEFIVTAMWQALKDVSSQRGDKMAVDEAFAITGAVFQRLYNDKKQFEKRFEK